MKKIRLFLLLTVMLFAMNRASAYDFEVDGIYYDVVSSSGLTCKVVRKSPHYKYSGDVVIPAHVNYDNKTLTVINMENELFYGCSTLTGITIPNTITSISNNMFSGCKRLERVKIEDGNDVLKLGKNEYSDSYNHQGLFYGCPIKSLYIGRNFSYPDDGSNSFSSFSDIETLKELTIGNSVTYIDHSAFEGCSGLTSVTIGTSVTYIGYSAFSGCSGLTSITIPNSVLEIDSYAFAFCSGLTSITIGNSVTYIGEHAFAFCSGLTSITIGNSVLEIAYYAFGGCCGLTNITIPNSVIEIGSSAFSGCSGLTSVTIPNSVIEIGSFAFSGCSGLTSVTIGISVTEIGIRAFSGCSNLTSITLPESVTEIGGSAFEGCSNLPTLILPESVTSIGDYNIVSNCTALYILNPTPPTISEKYFTTNEYMTQKVFVPQEALATYQSTEVWKDLWNLQGFDPTTLGIDNAKNDVINGKDKCYDILGNRLSAPKRGLNIINGKKVIVK